MPESLSRSPGFWPPPPETPEIRREQVKLTATAGNAVSVASVIAALIGPYITTIPDAELTPWVRLGLLLFGIGVHLVARFVLRYMTV